MQGEGHPYKTACLHVDHITMSRHQVATAWAEKFSHCSSSNDHLLHAQKKKVDIKMPACSLQKTTI